MCAKVSGRSGDFAVGSVHHITEHEAYSLLLSTAKCSSSVVDVTQLVWDILEVYLSSTEPSMAGSGKVSGISQTLMTAQFLEAQV